MRLNTGVPTRDSEPRELVSALALGPTRRVANRRPPRRPRQLPDRCPVRCGAVVVVDIWLATLDLAWWTLRAHDLPGAQTIGTCLFGLVWVQKLIPPEVVTGPGPAVALLFTVSVWCLLAPSLH